MEVMRAEDALGSRVSARTRAFELLYEAHYGAVHSYCARRVPRDLARDLTAEVFAIAWRRLDDVPAEAERAWLYGVAHGVVRNSWRSSVRRANLKDRLRGIRTTAITGPETRVIDYDSGAPVRRALGTLRPPDQEILRLAAWEQLTGPEIATVLGISLPAVQQRLSRAKRRLAAALAEHGSAAETSKGGEAS